MFTRTGCALFSNVANMHIPSLLILLRGVSHQTMSRFPSRAHDGQITSRTVCSLLGRISSLEVIITEKFRFPSLSIHYCKGNSATGSVGVVTAMSMFCTDHPGCQQFEDLQFLFSFSFLLSSELLLSSSFLGVIVGCHKLSSLTNR